MLELARNLYTAGRATQVDVIRLQVELSRLHTDLVELVAQQRSARALLNRLMARPADAPLGPPPPLTVSRVEPRLAAIEARMLKERPELVAARHAVARSQATLDSARKTADLPSFAVGIDYWLMPQASDPHAYGAMVSMSLPWLNPQHGEQVREAEHALDAERSALDAERDAARYALRDSVAQLHAARESFAIVQDELLPRAREAYEAAEAALVSGQGDGRSVLETLRTYLEVRIEQSRALARERTALSEVERSAGVELMDGEREASHE
jgi:cobalt-zinc-cadmium efflux system outer membrane protein